MKCHQCGKKIADIKIYVEHLLYECAEHDAHARAQQTSPSLQKSS